MAGVAKLFDGHILNKSNEEVRLKGGKHKGQIFGLYFSAHWCQPCRSFTPILIEFYKAYSKEKNFEIIFLSSDHDEKSFDDYYEDMPWLKLDFKEREKQDELSNKYHLDGTPTLVLVDGDSGDRICADATSQIREDNTGAGFPWKPSS